MTNTKKIIKILLPEIFKLIDGQNSSELVQKGTRNGRRKSASAYRVLKHLINFRCVCF
ncbi:MAG: hypothetical protein IJ099_05305 [Alphaproteobacteria bacterium]|nr:hypothetical protein [Alphaproteobacteria bacterium]